jgi:hypothetical protein
LPLGLPYAVADGAPAALRLMPWPRPTDNPGSAAILHSGEVL